jgi:pyruvate dehydrogenase E1 component
VIAGAYAIRRHENPSVTICAMGALLPEALAASARLDGLGFGTDVICVTSPGLLFDALRARRGARRRTDPDPRRRVPA